MKQVVLIIAIGCGLLAGQAHAAEMPMGPFKSDLKLVELASLPDGLNVVHTQNTGEDGPKGPTHLNGNYSTTVTSAVGPVTIVEFGCLTQEGGQWVYGTRNNAPFPGSRFAELFGCPGAELKPGESYTDPWNYSRGFRSPGQVTKWYFIGVDTEGQRVKGEAVVEFLSDTGC